MDESPSPTLIASPQRITRLTGYTVLGITLSIVILGWTLDFGFFRSVIEGWPTIKPITAISFLILSFVLLVPPSQQKTVALISAGLVFLLALLSLVTSIGNITILPSHSALFALPSQATSICFLVLSIAFIAAYLNQAGIAGIAGWFCLGLVVYRLFRLLFCGPSSSGNSIFDTMSLQTATLFTLLCSGGVLLNPVLPFYKVILSKDTIGNFTRRGLLFILLCPIAGAITVSVFATYHSTSLENVLSITFTAMGMAFVILFYRMLSDLWLEQELRKNYERRLRRTNKDLENFAYAASHDLQEPLRKIKVFSDLFRSKKKALLDEEANAIFERIEDSAARSITLIKDILHYSKSTQSEASFEYLHIEDIITEVIDELSLLIKDKHANIHVTASGKVYANRAAIKVVLTNLLSNALKYSKPQTQADIRISHYTTKDTVTISVSDNGIGINNKHIQTIQEPFNRLHSYDEIPGSGIGLATCKKILLRHHSELMIKSEVDEGSTFSFFLYKKPTD